MQKLLPAISVLIVLSGFVIYFQWLISDYKEGMNQFNTTQNQARRSRTLLPGEMTKEEVQQKQWERQLLLNPKDLKSRYEIARSFVEQCIQRNEYCTEALFHLNFLIEQDSTFADSYRLRGQLNLYFGDTLKAENDFEKYQ